MTPAARHAAAAAILDTILHGTAEERALTRWARSARYAGSKDRAAVRDLVFDVLRRRRSALWAAGAPEETGRALVAGLLAVDTPAALELWDGHRHAPEPLTGAERAALRPDLAGAPEGVRLDLPEALLPAFRASLGDRLEAAALALRDRAPVDVRVNLAKATVASACAALAEDGIAARPVDGVPTALRLGDRARAIGTARAYREGLVELQDAASQAVALAAGAAPGMRVLDLCAGGGGKTLALAALMDGRGRITAYDAAPRRMRDLPARAARAGADIALAAAGAPPAGPFDLILVDAPCSGSGSWRRDPGAKWRTGPDTLAARATVQDRVLDTAAARLAPGGRIAYATCSLLVQENAERVAAALTRHPALAAGEQRLWLPGAPGDGFFLGRLTCA